MSKGEARSPVIYDGEAGLITDGNKTLEVNRQGCRCLTLLIARKNTVVSKEELITQCWGKYGTIVSDNTVRQTLFQLRKILSELELPPDTLKTIPRQGYKLTSGRIITGEVLPFKETQAGKADNASEEPGGETREFNTTNEIAPSGTLNPGRPETRSLFIFLKSSYAVSSLCLIIFASVCALRYVMLVTPLSYYEAGQRDGRKYYIQDGFTAVNERILDRAAQLVSASFLRNIRGNNVYINRSERQNLSLFVCTGPVEDRKSTCTPVTALGDD